MRRLTMAVGGALAAVAALATAPAAQAQETGTVYVVHGIPNTPVDVYVDGQRAIDDFAPGSSQGPVDLPAGGQVTLVAHLSESGQPTITPFVNDVSPVPAGQARLVVRHTAAAPAVDVLAGGSPVIEGLTNPNEKALEVPAGRVSAAVAAADTTQPVVGPADLDLQEGTATFVHAVGSLPENTLSLVPVTVSDLHPG